MKRLIIKGKEVAKYQINIDILYIEMTDRSFLEEKAISLIAELENIQFKYVSKLNR